MATEKSDLHYLTIHEAQRLINRRELSPVELTRAILDRINAADGQLRAYFNLMADSALEEARIAEGEILRGNYRGPMHGIPVAVKDQLDVKGAPADIRHLDSEAAKHVADATVVRKLREAGAILLGKLTMSSMPSDPPQPRNPWDVKRITGGSSTGAGAASRHSMGTTVVVGMVAITILGVLLVPAFYVAVERLAEWRGAPRMAESRPV